MGHFSSINYRNTHAFDCIRMHLTQIIYSFAFTQYATSFLLPSSAGLSTHRFFYSLRSMSSEPAQDPFSDDTWGDDIDFDALEANAISEQENKNPSKSSSKGPQTPVQRVTPSKNPPAPMELPPLSLNLQSHPFLAPEALNGTLSKYFGFEKFLPNQLHAIQHILSPSLPSNDLCAYLPTGSGKSLIYTIPPLHTGRPAVIVSPLISLMEDQVYKLNAVVGGRKVAGFLSTASSREEEEACARGDRLIVFLTPERLPSWINNVVNLHERTSGGLSLIAVDEAHCVSEWGHDFRADYRKLDILRNTPELSSVPIVALTATSTQQVRSDVVKSLRMINPRVVTASVDRSNLVLEVERRGAGGYANDLKWLVDKVSENPTKESTIIYCFSKKLVEEIHSWLNLVSKSKKPIAARYHAGLTPIERKDSHINFLTSAVPIIVATTAFGMGIDKPDTRRVVNYSPPKTMEEYYQQVGRAGRDGAPATCIMYCNQADFDRYSGDFYTGGISDAGAKKAVMTSTASLNKYSFDATKCRRALVMEYFGEPNTFPNGRCGTCDNCKRAAASGGQSVFIDMTLPAAPIFKAINCLREPAMGTVEKVLAGKDVEDYRYAFNGKDGLSAAIRELRKEVPKEFNTAKFMKELIPILENAGFLVRSVKSTNASGRNVSFSVYRVDNAKANGKVMVPAWKEMERMLEAKAKKKAALKKELKALGMTEAMSSEYDVEVNTGTGPLISAFRRWKIIVNKHEKDSPSRKRLEELESSLQDWRIRAAQQARVAPTNVAADPVIYNLASRLGGRTVKLERDITIALVREVGVRVGGEDCARVMKEWWKSGEQQRLEADWKTALGRYEEGTPERQSLVDLSTAVKAWRVKVASDNNIEPSSVASDVALLRISYVAKNLGEEAFTDAFATNGGVKIGAGDLVLALKSWRSTYPRASLSLGNGEGGGGKVMSLTPGGKAWALAKLSRFVPERLDKWNAGESFASIAMNNLPKPIQAKTVQNNIRDAYEAGMNVDLERFLRESGGRLPTSDEWEVVENAASGIALVKERVSATVVVIKIEGMEFLDKDNESVFVEYKDRTDEQNLNVSKWMSAIAWYLLLKRTETNFEWKEDRGGGEDGWMRKRKRDDA